METVYINLSGEKYSNDFATTAKVDFDLIRNASGVRPQVSSVSIKYPESDEYITQYGGYPTITNVGCFIGTKSTAAGAVQYNTSGVRRIQINPLSEYTGVYNSTSDRDTTGQMPVFDISNDLCEFYFAITVTIDVSYPEYGSGQATIAGEAKFVKSFEYEEVNYITANDTTIGQDITVNITTTSTLLKRTYATIKWRVGTSDPVVVATNSSNKTFTISTTSLMEYAGLFQGIDYIPVDVIMEETDSSGNYVRGGYTRVKCFYPESSKPSLSATITGKDGGQEYYAGLTYAHIVITASAKDGSELSSWRAAVGTSIVNGDWSDGASTKSIDVLVKDGGSVTVSITVTDKRGLYTTKSQQITVTSYESPVIEIIDMYRCAEDGSPDPNGSEMLVAFKSKVSAMGGTNTATYTIKTRPRGTSAWGAPDGIDEQITRYTNVMVVSNGEYIFSIGEYADIECVIIVQDNYTTVESLYKTVGSSFALLDFDKYNRAIGIGGYASGSENVSIGLALNMNSHNITGVETDMDDDTSVVSVESMNARISEYVSGIMQTLYPIGSIYVSYNNVCAPQSIIGGTWERIIDGALYFASDSDVSSGTPTYRFARVAGTVVQYITTIPVYAWRRTA